MVDSADGPPEVTVERVRAAVENYLAGRPGAAPEARPPKARPPKARLPKARLPKARLAEDAGR